MPKKKLVVIGGGAAGFFCAVNAARLNSELQVTLLEKSNKVLSKVRISGGGRCNVTHACFDIQEMSKKYPRGGNFVKKTFHRFFTTDTISWFEERGVKLKAEGDGRMFPVSNSSQSIIDCLLREADKYGVDIRMQSEAAAITRETDGFTVKLQNNDNEVWADYVCIACGGYPKTTGFDWLHSFNHTIEDPVPSLFTFNMPGEAITKLMGITVEKVKVKILQTKLEDEGPLLITHWGMSGPVILRLSAWGARDLKQRNWEFEISINWFPGLNEQQLREKFQELRFSLGPQKIINRNPFGLPQRLWEFFLAESAIKDDTRWADLPAREQGKLIRILNASGYSVKGKTTFKEEFVTAGGIKLSEVDANSMMSKKVKNLFFAGEVLDVDGITGGFNFQHAWTSGFIGANSIALDS
jgi:predicted Rossmann fold flavoprotein